MANRCLLLRGRERLSERALARMWNGCADHDPSGQILSAWIAKEAAAMATDLIADLARAVADQPGIVVTVAVCERLGALLADDERSPVDVRVNPHHLGEATLAPAVAGAHRTHGRAAVPVPRCRR